LDGPRDEVDFERICLHNSLRMYVNMPATSSSRPRSISKTWHIDLIAEYLEAATGADQQMLINMPPR
jgi:hypothetical protein